MNNQREEIEAAVIESLEAEADAQFQAFGFNRRSESLIFQRKLPKCIQSVDVHIEHGPRDNLNAAAAVYPYLTVAIPVVDAEVLRMVEGVPDVVSSEAATLNQPIDFVAPKEVLGRWYIYQPDSVIEVVREFTAFSSKWLFPFLEDCTCAEDMVALHRTVDRRVTHDRGQRLRTAAAMVSCGQYGEAMQLLEANFGRPGPRRRYAAAFLYVQERLDEQS
jgi:hypothetical protein